MRIGLHVGKIIGGVIGSDIIRFDIYGDDVMFANKMESEGDKGKINVSEDLKILLENNFDDFQFEEQKSIEWKGQKKKMYFAQQKDKNIF